MQVHFVIYGQSDLLEVLKIARAVASYMCITHNRIIPLLCFHIATSVMHSITSVVLYNLFMHSSFTNIYQKLDILLSI